MTEQRVVEMARKAAELLPEPPSAQDPFGYLSWEELVVSTCRRLCSFVEDGELLAPVRLPITVPFQPGTSRLDGAALLTLAALLATGDDAACEGVLTRAVTACAGQPFGVRRTERHPRVTTHPRLAFDRASRSARVVTAPRG